jgi:hypothetical protein
MAALLACSGAAARAEKPPPDPVLAAMQAEVARAQGLSLGELDRPYYVSAAVNRSSTLAIAASFGALVSARDQSWASTEVKVRVGSPALDDTNFRDTDFALEFRQWFSPYRAPVELDPDALRQTLWLRLDDAYKVAVERIAHKRAFLQTKRVEALPPDFSAARLEPRVLPPQQPAVEQARWTSLVRKASALFRDSAADEASVRFVSSVERRWFVSSDGALDRFDLPSVELTIQASAQAPDGMEVQAGAEWSGRGEGDLPRDEAVVAEAQRVRDRIGQLVAAPVMKEEYSGPVLFTGRAAAIFFLKTLGEPLSGPRRPLGAQDRGRLTDRLEKHIASKIFTVRDDPTQERFKGKALLGAFPVDDEGVVPVPLLLVQDGVLKTYFMSRTPTAAIAASNGHCRGGRGAPGNLFVEAAHGISRARLKQALVEMAKDEDLKYGLLVEDFQSGRGSWRDGGGEGGFFDSSSSGGVRLPVPSVVYRVSPDGKEELVRGVRLKGLPVRALKDVVAVGADPAVVNARSQGERVSIVAPAVLVKDVETERPNPEQDIPPQLPRPVVAR